MTFAKTIGMVRVRVAVNARVGGLVTRIASGLKFTMSAAWSLRRSGGRPVQRYSIRRSMPPFQPNFASSRSKAATQRLASESCSENPMSTPIRRTVSGYCALAASGQAAAPPRSAMKSRRRIRSLPPQEQGSLSTGNIAPLDLAVCNLLHGSSWLWACENSEAFLESRISVSISDARPRTALVTSVTRAH